MTSTVTVRIELGKPVKLRARVAGASGSVQRFDTLLLGPQSCLLDSGWLWTAFRGLNAVSDSARIAGGAGPAVDSEPSLISESSDSLANEHFPSDLTSHRRCYDVAGEQSCRNWHTLHSIVIL
jgi:hypothetical protein